MTKVAEVLSWSLTIFLLVLLLTVGGGLFAHSLWRLTVYGWKLL